MTTLIERSDTHEHELQCEECRRFVQPGEIINVLNEPDAIDPVENRLLCTQCLIKDLA